MRWVLLANPAHPRVASLQAALAEAGLPLAQVVSYQDWLSRPATLWQALDSPCILKLEAPGEHAWVQDHLIATGAALQGAARPAALAHGELAHQAWWFSGFQHHLHGLDQALQARPWVRCLNPPTTVLAMCDKWACQQALAASGLSVPDQLGLVGGFAQLQAQMLQQGLRRVFVKPRYGSSASGVVALAHDGRSRWVATTSVEMTLAGRLFNSLKIRRYHDQAVVTLIDALAPNALYAEAWVPKPQAGGGRFDVRVLCLGQSPLHRVARVSRSPLTNLHLGNQRRAVEDCLDAPRVAALERVASQAAGCFPDAWLAGVDLIVGARQCHVLEVNAFGDWLPRLTWQGQTVHQAEVALLSHKAAQLVPIP
ncbi:glutathione synthase/RimK-type ligase-like ATP-grasp enzyme [Chitinivorax tropicus]|uniref:Glutathione synthase/RimK-type ligase-like ATP-grasp enzyme n=1 Tax=Chitinivorax tropicus TaxID=714531 RepID=A0A840MI35_9PROT|nr:STM4014 family protein [Chitinivorax tropicus]MBB5016849.1 glutathione synthase/RimK-type ligase-like ATP-grasp enzyme [Chitinivorax tropicus]